MIEGLLIKPLKQITDERGKVMHMMRCDSEFFTQFGEIYFSMVNSGYVKAWKRHQRMTQHFAVPMGTIQLVLYDNRPDSLTHEELQTIELGEKNYSLVKIPPLIWYGFKGISNNPALIANLASIPHDPAESEAMDSHHPSIPYRWEA